MEPAEKFLSAVRGRAAGTDGRVKDRLEIFLQLRTAAEQPQSEEGKITCGRRAGGWRVG